MTSIWWVLWSLWVPLRPLGTDSLTLPHSTVFSPSGTLYAELQGGVLQLYIRGIKQEVLEIHDPTVLGVTLSDSGDLVFLRSDGSQGAQLEAQSLRGTPRWTLRVPPVLGLRFSQDSRWLLVLTSQGLYRFSRQGELRGRYPVAPVYQAWGPWVALAQGFTVSLYRDTTLLWEVPLGMNRVRALYFRPPAPQLLIFTARQMILLDSTGTTERTLVLPGEYQAGTLGPHGPIVSGRLSDGLGVYWWDPHRAGFHSLLKFRPHRIGQRIWISAMGLWGDTLWILQNAKVLRYQVLWPSGGGDHAGP